MDDIFYACNGINPIEPDNSYELAVQEDEKNLPNSSDNNRNKRAVGSHTKFWSQNRVLKIGFFPTTKKIKDFIISTIKLWAPHINLTLEFVEDTDSADIRISTSKDYSGDWSAVGTDALSISRKQPTMHFDWNASRKQRHHSFWRVFILHEFGHALGLEHEHQHPDANIDWNLPAVYRIYKERAGFSKELTYANVLKKLPRSKATALPYDPKSIMHYQFPAEIIWNKIEYPLNTELSAKDIIAIKSIYPK